MEQVNAKNLAITKGVRTAVAFKKSQKDVVTSAEDLAKLAKEARRPGQGRRQEGQGRQGRRDTKWNELMDGFAAASENLAKVAAQAERDPDPGQGGPHRREEDLHRVPQRLPDRGRRLLTGSEPVQALRIGDRPDAPGARRAASRSGPTAVLVGSRGVARTDVVAEPTTRRRPPSIAGVTSKGTLPGTAANLALDEALLIEADAAGRAVATLRIWEPDEVAVVLGASGRWRDEVKVEACRADGVAIARRSSGGGTVVIGPGTLNVAVVLPATAAPGLEGVVAAQAYVLGRIAAALRACGPAVEVLGSGDLTLGGRKFSGSAQRRLRTHFLVHATILNRFPLECVERYTHLPRRQPAYRENRSHDDFLVNLEMDRTRLVQTSAQPGYPATVRVGMTRYPKPWSWNWCGPSSRTGNGSSDSDPGKSVIAKPVFNQRPDTWGKKCDRPSR